MNKNDKSMRIMAAAMTAVITAGLAGTCGYQQSAIVAKASDISTEELQEVAETALNTESAETEKEEAENEEEAQETAGEVLKAEKEQGAKKEESVYVKTDPSGNVKNTTVTEWIKNPGNGKVSDVSELEGIENIKGEETYQVSADAGLDWESSGNDIYYQGTTGKELPVGVKITYKLNGKEVSAKELQGKDGKAEIHIQYSNQSKTMVEIGGEKEEMFTPFTMITAMMFPTDEYQNVEIDHGKVLSDADKQIVVGLGFPGISENLKLAEGDLDFDLPEEVTITADVKNASVGPTVTVASTDFLQDLDFDGMDDFDDMSDSIEELEDATNQLVDGSKEAADGAGELAEGAGTLAGGTGTLQNGAGELAGGTGTLKDGARDLANGAGTLKTGIDTLNSKSGELIAGVQTLSNGITSYTQGVDQLSGGMSTLAEGGTQVKDGADLLQTKLVEAAGALGASNPYTSVANEAENISNSLYGLENTIQNISAQAQVVDNGGAYVQCNTAGLEGYLATVLSDPAAAGDAAAQIQQYFSASSDNSAAAVAEVTGEGEALAQVQAIQSMAQEMKASANTGSSQISAVQAVFWGDGGTNPGLVGLSQMVAEGAGQLNGGIALVQGKVGELQSYNSALSGGAAELLQGGQQLAGGVGQLATGADALNTGAGTLAEGAGTLNSGAGTLLEGVRTLNDGAKALSEGADVLADGNRTLADGMAEYKTEAIDKLTDLFDGDIAKAKDRLKAMADLGKEYQSFAGISSEMSGSTKFIIETEGVSE